ncbi:MAG: Na/Pi cotransporter family protein [Clostridia bacterium]|nr:Na/Pi cotransporter family protein [Clostridia bacterium]
MSFANVVALLGGIALFLFGMSVMGDSLKKVAGNKMEMILYKLSGNTFKGIILGTGVTAVIQSSSATSVMTVGFVNSGMMKIRQAIGVILGAILGTSITGWVLSLNSIGTGSNITAYFSTEILTGIVALIGTILRMFSKKTYLKNVGGILLGFAVLMYGMTFMSGAVEPLREEPTFINMLTRFSNPFLGVLVGMVFTCVIQSASAAVGILQALSLTGVISFAEAFPIILGIGIGASVPVMLSAIGAGTNGKRTAFAYLLIDVIGAIVCGGLFYALNGIFKFSFVSATMNVVLIALVNTLYRFATVVILSPAIPLLEKIVCRIFPEGEDSKAEREDMDRLEERFLTHPTLSINQSKTVIDSMAEKALESVKWAVEARRTLGKPAIKRVFDLEGVLDRYEDKLGTYLYKITAADLTKDQSKTVSKYLRVLSDFERISDHARNIGESVEEINEKKIVFSDEAEQEISVLEDAVCEITRITIEAFANGDVQHAMKVDPLEEVINNLCNALKAAHIDRVSRKECTLANGFVFNDLLTDYERIADHCANVAVDVIEAGDDEIHGHEYHKSTGYKDTDLYKTYLAGYENKYSIG